MMILLCKMGRLLDERCSLEFRKFFIRFVDCKFYNLKSDAISQTMKLKEFFLQTTSLLIHILIKPRLFVKNPSKKSQNPNSYH